MGGLIFGEDNASNFAAKWRGVGIHVIRHSTGHFCGGLANDFSVVWWVKAANLSIFEGSEPLKSEAKSRVEAMSRW